jgi:DNA-binding GntR family transcriptional regulator
VRSLSFHSVVAAKVTSILLQQLANSIERTKVFLATHDRRKHIVEDLRFHGLIAAASENPEFSRVFENIEQKSLLCRFKTYHLSGQTSPASHGKIYEALKRLD